MYFYELVINGKTFATYDAFLKSRYWLYRVWPSYLGDPTTSKYCFICDSPFFQLHHEGYEILGLELKKHLYRKLIPLCSKCHKKVHFDEVGEKIPMKKEFLKERRLQLRRKHLLDTTNLVNLLPTVVRLIYRIFH